MRYAKLLVLWCLAFFAIRGLATKIINVINYKAVGDGRTNDVKAFLSAWNAACADPSFPTILVPSGKTFLMGSVIFQGDCKSRIHFQVEGTIVAPNHVWKYEEHWIVFKNVTVGLDVYGHGKIDGRGNVWWSCRSINKCSDAPNAFAILNCAYINLSGLTFVNSPMKHIAIHRSSRIHLSGLTIRAPEESPNTDGVHIEESMHVEVRNSTIGTGDDCVSIGSGTVDLKVHYINCGPGHGISVGSLGRGGSKAVVEQIHVSHCKFFKTKNGLRIKTWQGGSGRANDIRFISNNFYDAYNPIIIDQFYCENSYNCPAKATAVRISNVHYIGATGTSGSKIAISLNCSQAVACTGITMNSIEIHSTSREPVVSVCNNVQGREDGPVFPPVPCLQ